MPRYAPNKMPAPVKRRSFELIRTGLSGSAAAQVVGVSVSCGSLWFIDAGGVSLSKSRSARAACRKTIGSRSLTGWPAVSRSR